MDPCEHSSDKTLEKQRTTRPDSLPNTVGHATLYLTASGGQNGCSTQPANNYYYHFQDLEDMILQDTKGDFHHITYTVCSIHDGRKDVSHSYPSRAQWCSHVLISLSIKTVFCVNIIHLYVHYYSNNRERLFPKPH
jgi:hypothetical protein